MAEAPSHTGGPVPGRYLSKLKDSLFGSSADGEAFIEAVCNPRPAPQALIWCKPRPAELPFTPEPPLEFQPSFVDRVSAEARPGALELHRHGYYYVLDGSSLFCASVVQSTPDRPDLVVDLCASPGGKSVFAWRALSPAELLCNEVIGKRLPALISNLERCSIAPARVLQLDPSVLARTLAGRAALVIADVPCSGQSLLVKGTPAPGCFHPSLINKCSNRQKRIAANGVQIVRPGGYLAYMTCTYALEENERVIAWLLRKFPELRPVEIEALSRFRSPFAEFPCYRLWPFEQIGAGGFCALLHREGGEEPSEEATLGSLRTIRRYS